MAEKVQITWNITLEVNAAVSTVYPLELSTDSHLEWGKYKKQPPSTIETTAGGQQDVTVHACGRKDSSSGTKGEFIYIAHDSGMSQPPTKFTFRWDVSWGSKSTSVEGFMECSSDRYKFKCDWEIDPNHDKNTIAYVTIKQTKPT